MGDTVPVRVYASCAACTVVLLLNGRALGARAASRCAAAVWDAVPRTPGNLTAVAYAGNSTAAAARTLAVQSVLTAGAPAALRVAVEWPLSGARHGDDRPVGDEEDAVLLSVQVVDTNGALVPTSDVAVNVSIRGPGYVLGLSNGDPRAQAVPERCDPTLGCPPFFPVWAGLLRVLVATKDPGELRVRATSAGLESGLAKWFS